MGDLPYPSGSTALVIRDVPGGGSDGKESACSAGDVGSVPGLGRFPGDLVKAIVFPVVMYRCESWTIF